METIHVQEKLPSIQEMNVRLSMGETIFESQDIITSLRSLINPVCIDIDGVLIEADISDFTSEFADPFAGEFLNEVEKLGSVIFLTHGSDWKSVESRLKQFGLVGDQRVIIALENFHPSTFINKNKDVFPHLKALCDEYCEQNSAYANELGILRISEYDYQYFGISKAIAPVFGTRNKPVPILDDSIEITFNNVGMYAIRIKSLSLIQRGIETEGVGLRDALEMLKDYYGNM